MVELKPTPGILHGSDILITLGAAGMILGGVVTLGAISSLSDKTIVTTPQGPIVVDLAIAAAIPIIVGAALLAMVTYDVGLWKFPGA